MCLHDQVAMDFRTTACSSSKKKMPHCMTSEAGSHPTHHPNNNEPVPQTQTLNLLPI